MPATDPRPAIVRPLLLLAAPVLVAQLAHMSMTVVDTVLVGRYGTDDLAGIAIGASVQITVQLGLVGIVQAVSPTVAHLHGAGEDERVAGAARQGVWLALLLGLVGFLILRHPQAIVAWSAPSPTVEAIAVAYLQTVAWGFPGQVLYRAFYAFSAALGRPRPVMAISALGAAIHLPLSYALIHGHLGGTPLGAVGAGMSMAVVAWFWAACAALYVLRSPALARYGLFARWEPPRTAPLRELLRLGLPMGVSSLVEVSGFTLIALFVAPLGAEVAAGHRIALNVAATCYMVPLALGYSLTVLVGQAAGAGDWSRARATAWRGSGLTAAVAAALALAILALASPIVGAYTTDPAVRAVALGLMGYCAALHLFDAAQSAASFCLRGYKVTFVPLLVHMAAFWGLGLAGGWWLAFGRVPALGVAGFWLSATLGTAAAALLLALLLRSVARARA